MKEYIARVISLKDPEEWQRAQVRVFEKFPEDKIDAADLPWATYKLPVGAGFNEGAFVPAKVGDMVWVDFPFFHHDGMEDAERPRITGAVHWSPDGLSTIPHDAFGGPKGLDDLHHVPEVDKEIDPDYEEPTDSELGSAAVFTKEGWTFRVQNGAWTATHRKTGARLEFSEGGNFDIFTPRNGFLRAVNKLKIIGGEVAIKATKLFSLDIPALEQKVKSWKLEAESVDITATGAAKILAKSLQFSADGDMILSGGGKRESGFSGSDLTKVGQDLTMDEAWGAKLHIEGVPLAKLLLHSEGLFEMSNTAANLKSDVFDALLASHINLLNAVSWFLDEYVKHNHLGIIPSSSPTTASAVLTELDLPGEFSGVGQVKITEAQTKINAAKTQLEALMK